MTKSQFIIPICIFVFSLGFSQLSFASETSIPLKDIEITQDQASLKRGLMVYHNICRSCHSMKYISYKNLGEIGFSKKEIEELRGENPKSAPLTSLTDQEMAMDIYGKVPPDLSVMAKARKHGPQYIYTLITSFTEKDGVYDNALFPGIKMPDILGIAGVTDAAEKTAIENQVKDVVEYLVWASDPRAAERKSLGKYVIAYFIILSILLYMMMKRVWSRLDQ